MVFSIWVPSKKIDRYIIEGELLKKIERQVSGQRAWDIVTQISKYHRIRGGGEGSDYNRCVDWLAGVLREVNGLEVKVEKFKADGFERYLDWLSPVGWRVKEAELWLLEPEERLLARFSDQAVSLMPYSQGGEIESDVIYVGQGKTDEDFDGKAVEGKLVFALGGNGAKVHREAVIKRGAIGVIVGPSRRVDRMEYPDLIEVNRLLPKGEERSKAGFGFALSRRQEDELVSYFDAGKKVIMKAWVDAEIIDGDMPTIDASIVGTKYPEQEIILMAHLDHYKPGANDNASGCAGLVEIVRNISSLIERGDIPPPKRTIRFLFLPELHGAAAYASKHPDIGERGIAGINLDMIGEDYELCKANFNLTCSPYSVPGYLNDILSNLMPWLEGEAFYSPKGSRYRFNYRVNEYSGGSDHVIFNDSAFLIPSVMLGHSNVFHHTNMDTTETCDPTEMKRIISLAEAATILLANAEDNEAIKIAREVYGQAHVRMAETTRETLRLLQQKASDSEGRKKLNETYWNVTKYPKLQAEIEASNLKEIRELCQSKKVNGLIDEMADDLFRQAEREREKIETCYDLLFSHYDIEMTSYEPSELYERSSILKPKRLFKGPLSNALEKIREELGEERARWYNEYLTGPMRRLGSNAFEIVNLMDGERNLIDIRHIVSLEFDEISIEFVHHYAEDLREMGLIIFS